MIDDDHDTEGIVVLMGRRRGFGVISAAVMPSKVDPVPVAFQDLFLARGMVVEGGGRFG